MLGRSTFPEPYCAAYSPPEHTSTYDYTRNRILSVARPLPQTDHRRACPPAPTPSFLVRDIPVRLGCTNGYTTTVPLAHDLTSCRAPFRAMEQQGNQQSFMYDCELPLTAEDAEEQTPFQMQITSSFDRPATANPTPTRLCFTASPAPSTPAAAPFNPDDFFASPPHNVAASRSKMTPECKRRLFLPSDNSLATPRATFTAPPPVFTPLRQVLAAHAAASSPQPGSGTSSFLTYGILSTPRGSGANAPPLPSSMKRPGRALLRDPNGLATFTVAPPASSPSISSLLSPHRNLLTGTTMFLPSPMSATPRSKLFQSSHMNLYDRTIPKPSDFTTPITPEDKTKCSCKASRCLKLYCPCFASSALCSEGCICKNCQNTKDTRDVIQEARQTVLSRDPKAFEPKRKPATTTNHGTDIHAKGCNCRKGCAKNYCVCKELRVNCGPRCTCSGPNGCLNGKDRAADHAVAPKIASIGPAPSRFKTSLPNPNSPNRPPSITPSTKITMQSLKAGVAPSGNPSTSSSRIKPEVRILKKENVVNAAPKSALPSFTPQSSVKQELTPEPIRGFRAAGGVGSLFSTPDGIRRLNLPRESKRIDFDSEVEALTQEKGTTPSRHHFMRDRTKYALPGDGKLLPSLNRSPSGGSPEIGRLDDLVESRKRRNPVSIDDFRMSDASIDLKAAEQKVTNPLATPETRTAEFDINKENLNTGDTDFLKSLRTSRDMGNGSGFPHTPDRLKVNGLSFATSPATDMRMARSTAGRFGRSSRGRQEHTRPPRILRVKMGSGRPLRKFAIGTD